MTDDIYLKYLNSILDSVDKDRASWLLDTFRAKVEVNQINKNIESICDHARYIEETPMNKVLKFEEKLET